MQKILVLGAGRSSHNLIQYLLLHAKQHNWQITIGDFDLQTAKEKIIGYELQAKAVKFDAQDDKTCEEYIGQSNLVVSLLPPYLHIQAAKACIKLGKSLFTASYVSPEIKALDIQAKEKGLLFMNELGLDPGIDHLSAMKIIHHLQAQGADIQSFKSYTGGLIAPDYDNNCWNYKFTWNPRNVVLAGQGTARYIRNGEYKYVPYHRLFGDIEVISVADFGNFDGYPNRDSLSYREVYGLQKIPTMIRGTLRKQGFCKAWDTFVQLGMTDDSFKMENSALLTNRAMLNAFLPDIAGKSQATTEEKLAAFLGKNEQGEVFKKIAWLGLLENQQVGLADASPAQILQKILENKWELATDDKDMIVMQHIFEYKLANKNHKLTSSMVVIGDNTKATAMAKTVGLPLAIGAKLFLEGKINLTGVQVPVNPQVYEPILAELVTMGITFSENDEIV
jgi:saccharopine dehydrogenase-like NADP-dependent oxidoreductase